MAEIQTTPQNAYAQFNTWLKMQPCWLQDAAWRIYSGKRIDDDTIRSYAEMCIAQIKKENPAYNRVSESDIADKKSNTRVSIASLSDIIGVNALADNATLEFAEEGITVVYGLNGAGKSGFMRIFKFLSNNPYEEPIQPNVFKKNDSIDPACKVCIKENGDSKEASYKLTSKQSGSLLSIIDVFDTRISNKYIGNENNVSYEPFVFIVLSELASVADKITHYLETVKSGISELSIEIPNKFASCSSLEWLQNLSEHTAIPENLKNWTNANQSRQEEISRLLDTEKVKQRMEVINGSLRILDPIIIDLASAAEAYSIQAIEEAFSRYCEAKHKLDTAQKLFGDSADEYDKISLDSSDWKALWSSAKAYYESVLYDNNGHHFAEKGSICPICHRSIDDRIERFANVDEYINGSCSADCKREETAFTAIYKAIISRQQTIAMVKNALAGSLTEDEISEVVSIYETIEDLKKLKSTEERHVLLVKLKIEKALSIVNKKKADFEKSKKELSEALLIEKKAELEKELLTLSAHKWAFDNLASIQQIINNQKRVAEIDTACQLLNTNRITSESNKLAEALITDAYIERFTHELKNLAPGIKVKLEKGKSRKGNTPYKVSIDTNRGKSFRTEDILSEGEQRIVALAAFFADATGRDERTPIIIDDPISSLDIKYEEKATTRIIELARERQIIVFTHRISMLLGLQEEAKNRGINCTPRYIRSTEAGKGVPDLESSFHGNVVSQLNDLRNKIARYSHFDPDSDEYEDMKGRVCQQFRSYIERSVEAELLLGTVERFRRNIVTKDKVKKLSRITEEDCEIVEQMMTKYSFTEHPQPIDSPPVNISYDDLDSDIEKYVNWIKGLRKRME